jgi:hypothetical protein
MALTHAAQKTRGTWMVYKYDAGQEVTFKDPRSLGTGFTVVQRMPGEYNASEPRYKIKSSSEGFERVVAESVLDTRFVDTHAWKLMPKVKRPT